MNSTRRFITRPPSGRYVSLTSGCGLNLVRVPIVTCDPMRTNPKVVAIVVAIYKIGMILLSRSSSNWRRNISLLSTSSENPCIRALVIDDMMSNSGVNTKSP